MEREKKGAFRECGGETKSPSEFQNSFHAGPKENKNTEALQNAVAKQSKRRTLSKGSHFPPPTPRQSMALL